MEEIGKLKKKMRDGKNEADDEFAAMKEVFSSWRTRVACLCLARTFYAKFHLLKYICIKISFQIILICEINRSAIDHVFLTIHMVGIK